MPVDAKNIKKIEANVELHAAKKMLEGFFFHLRGKYKPPQLKKLDENKTLKPAKELVGKLLQDRIDTDVRALYESELAYLLYQNPKWFENSVGVISAKIIECIEKNKTLIDRLCEHNPLIKKELYHKSRFGHLVSSTSRPVSVTNDILVALKSHQDFAQVMHIHATFFEMIMMDIAKETYKPDDFKRLVDARNELTDKLNNTGYFEPAKRGRLERKGSNRHLAQSPTAPRPRLGTVRSLRLEKVAPLLFHNLEEIPEGEESRAVDRFIPDANSSYVRKQIALKRPFVAGPSGHTCILLKGATLSDVLHKPELREYALACFVTLTAGGNHSWFEVMLIAKLFGLCEDPGNYNEIISPSIKLHTDFVAFANKFLTTERYGVFSSQFKGANFAYNELPEPPKGWGRKESSLNPINNKSYEEMLARLRSEDAPAALPEEKEEEDAVMMAPPLLRKAVSLTSQPDLVVAGGVSKPSLFRGVPSPALTRVISPPFNNPEPAATTATAPPSPLRDITKTTPTR